MNEPITKIELEKANTPPKANRFSKFSLWMGILAIFPYVCGLLFYWWHDLFFSDFTSLPGYPVRMVQSLLAYPALLLGAICGFPFGLAGIITGGIGLTRKPKTKRDTVFAFIGVIFSIGGLIGHYWYFATCQFCQ